MKCPKCYHESSSEDLVRNIAECSCDCHKRYPLGLIFMVFVLTLMVANPH